MTSKRLTKDDALLLQRHVDGEWRDGEREAAQALLERSQPARIYVSALESLGEAVRAAEEQAWQSAALKSPQSWVELAEASSDLSDTALDDLAPMLERFHDGEVDHTEAAVVAALIDERDDVAQYLSELERIAAGIQQAGSAKDVDFDGFWEGIAEAIDDGDSARKGSPVGLTSFDADEHRELLYRYHDGETSAEEQRQVEAWIDADEPEVDQFLGALAEVHLGVSAGIEVATKDADLDQIWDGLGEHLDAIDAERAADNVVSFESSPKRKPASNSGPDWVKPLFAAAAAVALLTTGALIGPQLFQDDEPVETQTLVIFDSIESAPGSSVFLHAPQLADHEIENGMGHQMEHGIRAEDDDADPTVLWLIEDDDDSDDDDDESEEPTDELPGPI